MPGEFADLAEHTGTLVALIACLGTFAAAIIGAIWKLNGRMVNDLAKQLTEHLHDSQKCQLSLPVKFADKEQTEGKFTALFNRQDKLREEILPMQYVRREELTGINQMNATMVKAITDRLDQVSGRLDSLVKALLKPENGGI